MPPTAPTFTNSEVAEQHQVQIVYAEFNPNRSRNIKLQMDIHLLSYVMYACHWAYF
jgi:hypothetical protein